MLQRDTCIKNIDSIFIDTKKYDFLIVGSGLFGSVCAYLLNKKGYKVLVIDKRGHIGGNVYTSIEDGICVHKYGAHIFHTNNKEVWDFVNMFDTFEPFQNEPIANFNGNIFNLPFNMHTFYQVYGINTIEELEHYIDLWDKTFETPNNLEEYAIKRIGEKAYKKLVKGYTEKQWGTSCRNLDSSILGRLPIRKEWNNNYFNDKYQGIPEHGYSYIIEKLLYGIDVKLNETFDIKTQYNVFDNIIYCGSVDELFNYELGTLEYRSLKFIEEKTNTNIGVPVMNFTSKKVPYTRIIEHKRFLRNTCNNTNNILTYEYPVKWDVFNERYYPINNDINNSLYKQYVFKVNEYYPKIKLGGRLGLYKYLNMDEIIEYAFKLVDNIK